MRRSHQLPFTGFVALLPICLIFGCPPPPVLDISVGGCPTTSVGVDQAVPFFIAVAYTGNGSLQFDTTVDGQATVLNGQTTSPSVTPTSAGFVEVDILAWDETGLSDSVNCFLTVEGEPHDDPCDCDDTEVCVNGTCIASCTAAADCDDADPCTDDACVDGACSNTAKDCDDGLFCTGTETCNANTGTCNSSGDPCGFGVTCDEGSDTCDADGPCSNSGDCDDGIFCNGIESCIGGTCFSGSNPCANTDCSGLETVCEEGTTTAYCSCLQIEGDVILVEEETSLILESLDENSLTFSHSGQPPNIQVGDILMGTQGGGYLREVTSIDYGNNTIFVTTVHSAMDQVVEHGSFSTRINVTPSDQNQRSAQAGVRIINATGVIDLTGLRLLDSPNLVVDVTSGSLRFSPDVDVDIDFRPFFLGIDSFEASAAGTLDFNLDMRVVASAPDSQSFELQLASYSQPFVAGPVAGVVTLSFSAGVEVSASVAGDVEGGFSTNHYVRAGARYENHDWSIISERSSSFDPHEPVWNLGSATVRVYVEPKVEVFFFGVAGPSIDIELYVRLGGSFQPPTCEWDLSAGFLADANFRVGFLSFTIAEFTAQLFDYHLLIDNGQCSSPPGSLFVYAGPNKVISPGGSTILEGFVSGGLPPYSYSWSPTIGLTNPNILQPTALPTSATTYTLTATDSTGDFGNASATVFINENPCEGPECLAASAGPDRIIASGESTVLLGSASGGNPPYSYSWFPTTGLSDPFAPQPTATPGNTTSYTLTVTDSDGHPDTDSAIVTVLPDGSPMFEEEPNDSPSSAHALGTLTQSTAWQVGGTLPAFDEDWFSFEVSGGVSVTIAVDFSQVQDGVYTTISLKDEDVQTLISDSGSDGSVERVLSWTFATPGTHYIRVDTHGSGTYEMSVTGQ